jgi:hypothetical protein
VARVQVTFEAELYRWESDKTSWVFVTLPHDVADAIDEATSLKGGFGSVKVDVEVGSSTWSTSLFPSKEHESYVLPVKKAIRQAEGIDDGDIATFTLDVLHAEAEADDDRH